jgi:polysaccharide biosynthesis transport protein
MDNHISGTHPSPHEDRHDDEYEDEMHSMKYVLVLWRHRLALLLMTLACGLAVFLVSWRSQPVYEATARVVVNQSKMLDGTAASVSMAGYRELLDNQSVASQILDEFGLDKAPYNFRVSSFRAGNVSFEVVRETNVITITVRLPDAALAGKVANRWVELSLGLARRLSQEEATTARDLIGIQFDEARGRLAGAEEALGRFKKEAQIDLVQKDVESLLKERGTLVALSVEIEGERARLAKAEEEFARQERVRTERSALDASATLREATQTPPPKAKRDNAQPSPEQLGIALRSDALSPFINPVYEYLDQQISMSRTNLAALEKRRAELVGTLKLGAPVLAQLTQLYGKQRELARLQMEFDLAQKIYAEVAARYEQSRVQVTSRTAQLQVLDSALPPDRPISPRPLRSTAIGLALGFVLSMLGVLIFDVIASSKRL